TDAPSPATAQSGAAHRPLVNFIRAELGRLMVLKSELDITDAQKEQIKTILQSHKAEIAQVAKPLVDKKRALRDAVMADAPDEKAIRAASDDLAHSIGDAAVLASKIKQEVAVVLTPDQL